MGHFHPPDHAAGDANTIGGYRAVHGRPAAFEATDGSAYSVEIITDRIAEPRGEWGAYLLFVRWQHGDPVASGHLETGYIAFGATEQDARAELGKLSLLDAKRALDELSRNASAPARPWYEVMRDA